MSQQKKLEQVLDLLLSEDSENAAEILHQIIVEKARAIYESIVDEEDESAEDTEQVDESEEDEVGGDPDESFTDEISDDQDEIESDEENGGEPELDDELEADEEESTEDRVEELETQLAELRAEFDELMSQELEEPNHEGLGDEMGEIEDEFGGEESDEFGGEESDDFDVEEPAMFEKKKEKKLEVAKQAKKGDLKKKGEKKVDEETQFLTKVADTGQKGTAKLVGTGKGMTLGAEQNKSPYTSVPARKDYGGKPAKIGGGTGGEYGKYNGDSATDETITDNVDIEPKKNSVKADTTAKFTGGKSAGASFDKSPLSKKP